MKRLLPFAFILFAACNKESISIKPKTNGIVKYSIEGEAVEIMDSTSQSVARLIYTSRLSKGFALHAYNTNSSGQVLNMISFYINTDKIEPNHQYSKEVTGTILIDDAEYACVKDVEDTYIQINIREQQNQILNGTFTG